ncbi:MAG TPA: hypothetical protein VF881_14275, partial [Polyangiaceae bacterium]
ATKSDRDARMNPGDEVLLRMVDLATRASDDASWQGLAEEAERARLQPYELVELLEARARAAHARGERARARAFLEEALAIAQRSASSVADRVARTLGQLVLD